MTPVREGKVLYSKIKYVYHLSRVFCLMPLSISLDPTGCLILKSDFKSNCFSFLWMLFVMAMVSVTFVSFLMLHAKLNLQFASDFINASVNWPLSFLLCFISIIELIYKRNDLLVALQHIRNCDSVVKISAKCNTFSKVQIILFFMFIILVTVDLYLYEEEINAFTVLFRIPHLINIVFSIQFTVLVKLLSEKLFAISNYIVSNFECAPSLEKNLKLFTPSLLLVSDVQVLNIRKAYHDIYKASKIISSVYASNVLVYICRLAFSLVTIAFKVVKICEGLSREALFYKSLTPGQEFAYILVWIIAFVLILVHITYICQVAKSGWSQVLENIHECILYSYLNRDALKQMKMFSSQASTNKIQFVGLWVFNLDMSMFFTIMATVFTYLMVLRQL